MQEVRIIENTFIELKDGVRLSTRMWLPADAGPDNPVPAIFEFLPYRKRDVTTSRDEVTYQVFARNGYAGVRVDMRGCGDSTGMVQDEYVLQEQLDAVECIEWIRCQSWCTGKIGMMGISWGGFNSLQVACHSPDILQAIIPIAFTDDRYNGDIHFRGGVMLIENITWASSMELRYTLPPDPLFTENWKEVYLERLENLTALSTDWMKHPLRDQFWKHGSIREDPEKIKSPALLIAGFADSYSNNVMPTMDVLACPKRAIVGPWLHLYPHLAEPEPKWPFCTEAINWWDRWLKGLDTHSDEPETILYLQNRDPAHPQAAHVAGEWICDPKSASKTYFMSEGKLGSKVGKGNITFNSDESCGFIGGGAVFPRDIEEIQSEQSAADKLSCYFETDPFEQDTSFCGNPIVHLSIASDKPDASVFVRICKVNQDGDSIVLNYTARNLTHDESHEKSTPLRPGEFMDVEVKLSLLSETMTKGTRLRLCFTSSYFPTFVPNPECTTFTLDLSKCSLTMPELTEKTVYEKKKLGAVTDCVPLKTSMVEEPYHIRSMSKDAESGRVSSVISSYTGKKKFEAHGLVTVWKAQTTHSILPDDPTSAIVHQINEAQWSRGEDWIVDIVTTMDFRMDKDHYYTTESRKVTLNRDPFFNRDYNNVFSRK